MDKPAGSPAPSASLLLLLTLALSGCDWMDPEVLCPSTPEVPEKMTRVSAVELVCYIVTGLDQETGYVDRAIAVDLADGVTAGSGGNHSTTNVQETGVDEADRIESDGEYLYILDSGGGTGTGLRVMALAAEPPSASQVVRLPLADDAVLTGMYLADGGTIAAIGGADGGYWYETWSWRNRSTDVVLVDAADPANPRVAKRLRLDGALVSSRRIGSMLYLVTRFTPALAHYEPYPTTRNERRRNRDLLQNATLDDLLPAWHLDGRRQGRLYGADDCWLLPGAAEQYSPDLVAVSAIDLSHPTEEPQSVCLVGSSETLYASTRSLYLATTRYAYEDGDADALGYPSTMKTDIHKLGLVDGAPRFEGSATVEGHLGWRQDMKPFRMGEHEGVLRIVTSIGAGWSGDASTRLTLLAQGDGGLVEVAHLPNDTRPEAIGKPGEQLYAARFIGDRGYLVTFRTTDPLYVLDLSVPEDPFIAGSLEIPGYSDYLHPVSTGLLLGIGKEAVAAEDGEWRGAWPQGVKLALFDVSDPGAPTVVDSRVIGKRGTESDALYDHHALAWLPGDAASGRPARLALPIALHDGAALYGDADEPWTWYGWTHTGLHLFDIDPEPAGDGITDRGTIVVEQADGEQEPWWDGYSSVTDRALLRGDEVHYVHGGDVWSASWGQADAATGPQ